MALVNVLSDPSQVNIQNMTVKLRVSMLKELSTLYLKTNLQLRNMNDIRELTKEFIDSIKSDITSLDENSVINLMTSLNNLMMANQAG